MTRFPQLLQKLIVSIMVRHCNASQMLIAGLLLALRAELAKMDAQRETGVYSVFSLKRDEFQRFCIKKLTKLMIGCKNWRYHSVSM